MGTGPAGSVFGENSFYRDPPPPTHTPYVPTPMSRDNSDFNSLVPVVFIHWVKVTSQRISLNPSFGSRDRVPPSSFWSKFDIQCAAVTLKMRFRSPKYNHLFTLSLLCVFATLVKVHQLVHILKLESTLTPTGSAPKSVLPSLS